MKILVIAKDYPPTIGGVENYSFHVAQGLSDKYFVEVLTFKAHTSVKSWEDNIRVIRLKPFLNNEFIKAIQMVINLFMYLRKNKVDVVYATTWKVAMSYALMKKLFKAKLIIVCHGAEITRHKNKKIIMKLMNSTLIEADHLFSVSEFTKTKILEYSAVSSESITVIPNGIDIDKLCIYDKKKARKKIQLPDDLFIILTVSRIDYRKGHELVLNALSSLLESFPSLHYVIVGNGPNKSKLEHLSKVLKIENNVTFTGFISDEDLDFYYSAADIFVMINTMIDDTDFEGFGLVFAEAGYYSMPLIGGNNAGPKEVIQDGKSGFLIEPKTESLIECITGFVSGKYNKNEFGHAAFKNTCHNFSISKMIKQIETNLMKIVKNNIVN